MQERGWGRHAREVVTRRQGEADVAEREGRDGAVQADGRPIERSHEKEGGAKRGDEHDEGRREQTPGSACETGSRPIRPVRSCSRRRSPVMRKPLMTKKTSTPTKPPAIPARPARNRTTTRTASPRRPSMSGRNPSWVLEAAGVGTITSLELSVTGDFSADRTEDAEVKRLSQVHD